MIDLSETLIRTTGYEFLGFEYFGNSVGEYTISIASFLLLLLLFKLVQTFLIFRLRSITKRTKTDLDDTFVSVANSIKPPFYTFVSFYLALEWLEFSGLLSRVLDVVLIVWIVYQVVQAVSIFAGYVIDKRLSADSDNAESAVNLIKSGVKFVIWTLGGIFLLSNLGVNVTSFIAGLGIGGIAIAFALQSILSDLFSSFAIFFDKPFKEGDYIMVGSQSGIVEKIGIKTTRIRALQGEEIVFSNQELTSAQIQNFKKLERRRIVFEVGVSYDTSNQKMKKIPKIIEEIINQEDKVEFDRVFFHKLGDSALIFEVVYHVDSPEYPVYLAAQQSILLQVKKEFEKEKIEIAYPTKTIFMHKVN